MASYEGSYPWSKRPGSKSLLNQKKDKSVVSRYVPYSSGFWASMMG